MELQAAWQRAQALNALIGPRPDIRNQYGDRIVENYDDVTLAIDGQEITLPSFEAAEIELQARGRIDDTWQ